MAFITVPEGLMGISGPMAQYPNTARHLNGLAEDLLRTDESLTKGERELIATYVSSQNECKFCANTHGAAAKFQLDGGQSVVDQVRADFTQAAISEKMKALLVIAGKVQQGGLRVTEDDVALARREGADDRAIHDTVLIAAAFCMYNRYVDGLRTTALPNDAAYDAVGRRLAAEGYTRK